METFFKYSQDDKHYYVTSDEWLDADSLPLLAKFYLNKIKIIKNYEIKADEIVINLKNVKNEADAIVYFKNIHSMLTFFKNYCYYTFFADDATCMFLQDLIKALDNKKIRFCMKKSKTNN